MTAKPKPSFSVRESDYGGMLAGLVELLESARRAAARRVNALMTAVYWETGRRIGEHEQKGERRAGYGEALLERLAADLTARFGRGFSRRNLQDMRGFYAAFPAARIRQTLSAKSAAAGTPASSATPTNESPVIRSIVSTGEPQPAIRQTPFAGFTLADLARAFPLPWSHYVLLISRSRSPEAREFYHAEALRGGWSVRQLVRQIDTQFYERTALSRNKAALLAKGARATPEDAVTAAEEVGDPLVLEFLGLKDEYSETDLEDALIRHLEHFLLELGNDFAFVGRQRRLRIDDEWYRIDLLFFHRRLRCLVVIDLKLGRFTHADAGQMNLYLNYAREHWTHAGENPPVGLILCAHKGEALVRYATTGLPNKLVVREYLTVLPKEELLASEIEKTRRLLENRT